MKAKLPASLPRLIALAVCCFMFLNVTAIHANESEFISQFTEAKKRNNFAGMKYLVKQYKENVPDEVERIRTEAEVEGTSDGKRLGLLNLAYTIAKMHQEWNGGYSETVAELEATFKAYRQRMRERQSILDEIKKVEIVPGNFVLNTRADEMKAAGVNPVIYPHWVHRSFFRCKVCHESLVIMKRGTNALTHAELDSGKLCGSCHNGTMSFNTTDKDNCSRCHMFGTPEAEGLIDLSYYDEEKFTATAAKLGGKWHGDKMPDGKFPLSKLGYINWVELDELDAFEPLSSLGDDVPTEGVRETQILFAMPEKYAFMLDNVLWSHKIHSTWINCSICHESTPQREQIFTKTAGETRVSMIEIKEGKSCGTCHDRVSFHVSDCKRCHNYKGVDVDANTIVRQSIAEAPPAVHIEEEKPKKSSIFGSSY